MANRKPNRVYFIGSGPSIAMGVPSVDELYGKILEGPEVAWSHIREYVETVFPHLEDNRLNFEELMTSMDAEGIGPEIYKFSRFGTQEFSWNRASVHSTYEDLMKRAFKVIHDQMSDLEMWAQYAQMKAPNNDSVKEEILSKRRPFEPIRKAWSEQYKKINGGTFKEYVLTTNYDLWIEKWASNGYTYTSIDSAKTMILKLHGSINWQRRTAGEFYEKEYFQNCEILSFEKDARVMAFPIDKILGMISFATDVHLPIIVPPMALKRYDDPIFRQMFWHASNVLLNSDELVILGYRFSDFDFYVKKLIDYAINSKESKIKRVFHYDNDEGASVRFKNIIRRPELKKKENYIFVNSDFRKMVPDFSNLGNIKPIP